MSLAPKKKSIKTTTKTVVKPTTTIKQSKTTEKGVNDEITRKLSVPSKKSDKILLTKRSETSLDKPDVVPKKLIKSKSLVSEASTSTKGIHRNSLGTTKVPTESADVRNLKATKTTVGASKSSKNIEKQQNEHSTKQSKEPLSKSLKALPKAKALDQTHISKTNVMNTIHNVTVISPPSSAGRSRSELPRTEEEVIKPRDRTRTRTLEPEEIVLLKPNSNESVIDVPKNPNVKPIAFEIKFEEPKKPKPENNNSPIDEYNYESDFESYESDFESEVSNSKSKSLEDSEETENSIENSVSDTEEDEEDENEGEEEQEVIEIRSARERQLDSGNFELSKRSLVPGSQLNSIDESTIHSSDSGISYDDGNSGNLKRMKSPRSQAFLKRGEELMKKITLDDMKFNLYESKPIPYDIYMQLYGQRNTEQSSCQTESFVTHDAIQTEKIRKHSMWTQYPPTFSKEGLINDGSTLNIEEKLGVGEGTEDSLEDSISKDELKTLVDSLNKINTFNNKEEISSVKNSRIYADFNRLNQFLQNASVTIANIFEKNNKSQEFHPSKMSVSQGYYAIPLSSQEVLKNTIVTKLYTNQALNNLLITVHQQKDSLQNLLCLWNILHTKDPLKIFSSWSKISCLEIHQYMPEVIVAGCEDGTIVLWNTKERIDWKQKIANDRDYSIVTPCEVVCLNEIGDLLTLINTVAIKSLPQRQVKFQNGIFKQTTAIQICSLHENGFLAIWSVMKMNEHDFHEDSNENLSFIAPSSKFKLVKNLVIDLNAKLGKCISETSKKSNFEKKVYYFENDIFSDKVLKELQQIDEQKAGKNDKNDCLAFFDLDVNLNEFFMASESNFVMTCSRINFDGKSRKISVDPNAFLTPSVVKVHPTDKNVLAIGLSNGNLIFANNKLEDEPQDFYLKSQQPSSSKRSSSEDSGSENLLSKSCTIQNIIENERKLYEETQALNNLEMDELKAFMINETLAEQFQLQESIKLNLSYEKPIFNSFIVNRSGVRGIDFTREGELLFALIGDQIKVFNCVTGQEVETDEDTFKFRDMRIVHGGDGLNYLILLTTTNEILVNKLKK